ncbi:MAG TPA: AIPR family protein [Clostridia bacterium]
MYFNFSSFSLINSSVENIKNAINMETASNAFYYFALNKILNLSNDDISESITDNYFLKTQSLPGGHDRGIDAVYLDDDNIYFFNMKYTEDPYKSKNSNFPSSEVDKILKYFDCLYNFNKQGLKNINDRLKQFTQEIWSLWQSKKANLPSVKLYLCSNYCSGLEKSELERLNIELKKYNIEIKEYLLHDFVILATRENIKIPSAKFRADKDQFFVKCSVGDIKALIVSVNALDLIRMISTNENYRMDPDLEDTFYDQIEINEDVFYDNVRVYKKAKGRINKTICNTARSEDRFNFFYYNNGITITCKSFSCTPLKISLISINEFQVVNGCQTLHALFDVFKENYKYLKDIDILCRIYELKDRTKSVKIAEYTNSQNPVKSRDIRSIDFVQEKLEEELKVKGFKYLRKAQIIADKNTIDAEKAGQAMLAFYLDMPRESKNAKGLIFGDKYEQIFHEDITADYLLLPYQLLSQIENKKKELIDDNTIPYIKKSYILYCSYYILYLLKELAKKNNIELNYKNCNEIFSLYDNAKNIIDQSVQIAKSREGEKYVDQSYFKSSRVMDDIQKVIQN